MHDFKFQDKLNIKIRDTGEQRSTFNNIIIIFKKSFNKPAGSDYCSSVSNCGFLTEEIMLHSIH